MQITEKKLRGLIKEIALNEFGGKLRRPSSRAGGKQQFKVGKVEDEAGEMSTSEVEQRFPGAVDAWVEVGPAIFPDMEPNIDVFDDPRDRAAAWLKSSVFFIEDGELSVAAAHMPQLKLMVWDSGLGDWVDAEN